MVIEVKEFVYRRPRHRADIPVLVRLTPLYSIRGRCTDVSAEGLGARLDEAPPDGRLVEVEFVLRGRMFCTPAWVNYRSGDNYFGLRFQFTSELERDALEQLLRSIHRVK